MEEEKIEIKKHDPYVSLLWTILAFIFPMTEYMFYVMWKEKGQYEETEKKAKLAAIAGSALQIILILVTSIYGLINGETFFDTTLRSFLFYVFLLYALESTSVLVFAHEYVVKFEDYQETKIFKLGRKIAVALTTIFSILMVYQMDAVMKTPLPKGFPLNAERPTIAFYALFILTGALVSLLIASNKIHKLGERRDFLEKIFYIAFPMGLVGARAWWVISEWNRSLANNHSLKAIFDVRSGGLAVQGGVLLGAFVGIWILTEMKKEISSMKVIDAAIPGILIAQAIGRLGNFTNIEVYGAASDPAKWWFLPQIIVNQYMNGLGHFVVPLFLVEAMLNILGYFLITYIVGGLLKKWVVPGAQAYCYLIWYGTVRYILEPLRDEEYIMGTSGRMSLVFILLGIGLLLVTHVISYIRKKNPQLDTSFIEKRKAMSEKMDNRSKTFKILMSLPLINGFYYGFYRFVKGHYYSGFAWIIFGSVIGWIFDLYFILKERTLWMSKEK